MITAGRVAGLIQAMGGGADPAVIESAVQDWLDQHPEATTTVQDGSITEQKLATSIAQKLGLISSLSDEIVNVKSDLNTPDYAHNILTVKGEYVAGGTITPHGAWDRSDYIPVDGLDFFAVQNDGERSAWNGFFANNTDTSALTTFSVEIGLNVISIPDGAHYAVISNYVAQYPLMHVFSEVGYRGLLLDAVKKDTTIANENVLSDGALYFNPLDFQLGNLATTGIEYYTKRVVSNKMFQNHEATHIKSEGTYKFYLNIYKDDGTYKNTSGWVSDYTVPSNTKFKIMFSPTGSASTDILSANLIPDYIVNLSYTLEPDYSYFGERLIPKRQGFSIQQLSISPNQIMQNTSQGLAIYEHTLFQICGDYEGTGHIVSVDIDTGVINATYDAVVGHGGNAFFLNEFYADGDEYPLLCVCSNNYPNTIRVFRITENSAVKVREYLLNTEDGYWSQATYDTQTGRLYSIGYTANSYSDKTNNKSIIAVYNLLNLTQIEENVYKPELIARYTIPFIYCTQGLIYYAGKLIIISSYSPAVQKTWFYIIEPMAGHILGIIKDFPVLISDWEVEGVDIVDDEWLLIGTRPRYFKMTLY